MSYSARIARLDAPIIAMLNWTVARFAINHFEEDTMDTDSSNEPVIYLSQDPVANRQIIDRLMAAVAAGRAIITWPDPWEPESIKIQVDGEYVSFFNIPSIIGVSTEQCLARDAYSTHSLTSQTSIWHIDAALERKGL